MANPVKGEVAFEVDGATYTFVFGTWARAVLERKTGTTVSKFFDRKDGEDFGQDEVLSVFHAALDRHHSLPEKEVADLMDRLGIDRVSQIVSEGLALAFPEAAKGSERPQKPARSRTA